MNEKFDKKQSKLGEKEEEVKLAKLEADRREEVLRSKKAGALIEVVEKKRKIDPENVIILGDLVAIDNMIDGLLEEIRKSYIENNSVVDFLSDEYERIGRRIKKLFPNETDLPIYIGHIGSYQFPTNHVTKIKIGLSQLRAFLSGEIFKLVNASVVVKKK